MKRDCLVDSDVLIDFFRGRSEAVEFIRDNFHQIHLSVISIAELFAGVRDGPERKQLEAALDSCNRVGVTVEIAKKAGLYKRSYGKSHGVTLPDALIAATAEELGLSLATLNKKHFPMISTAFVPYRKN